VTMHHKKKVVYIISNVRKALAFEWINDRLDRSHFDLLFILIGERDTELGQNLERSGNSVLYVSYKSKPDLPVAFVKIIAHLRRIAPDVVHTHLFEANLLGLTAAWLLRIRKRIFTRHHAMVHHQQHPKGLKWDKWINRIATDIIAISENVRYILIHLDHAEERKIHLIHHGFDLNYFDNVPDLHIRSLREKYHIPESKFPVIGVIARYEEWKGIQFIIPAFNNLLQEFPAAHLVLANAGGSFAVSIKRMLSLLPAERYTEISFENDLSALYKLFHVYVHVPVDARSEAFGQTYIEALMGGVPSVFTLSGVASEFVHHEQNALVVPYKSEKEIAEAIVRLLKDDILRKRIVDNGQKSVQTFSLQQMLDKFEVLYG
jgi:glycosyltransferase involved in cell wall biosynthesis